MFGKAENDGTAQSLVCRDPDGMVKAILPEPQCPLCKSHRLDTAGKIQGSPRKPRMYHGVKEDENWIHPLTRSRRTGLPLAVIRAQKGHLNRPIVTYERNMGLPKGGDPQGNGDPIVVRVREILTHGEGGQVSRMSKEPRYA